MAFKTRRDVRLPAESKTKPDAGDPLGSYVLQASVSTSRKAATNFYGQPLGKPSMGATVRLQAQGPWIAKPAPETAVDGQAPENATDMSVAIQSAFGANSKNLHKFLDQVTELRCKRIETDFQKRKGEDKGQKAAQPKR